MPASLHETASISRRVNAKYVCTNILYKFSIGSVNLKIVHLQHMYVPTLHILSCSKIQPKNYQTHLKVTIFLNEEKHILINNGNFKSVKN